jgi:probable HAF family extracellular repeat protein
MFHNTACTILWTIALSLGTAKAADTFISFDFRGATSTTASDINADGAVVGWYVDSAGKTHGFLLRHGSFTSIDYPRAVYTDARGINAQGDIVGCHMEDATRIPGSIGCHGFLLRQGVFTPIDFPGKYGTIAQRINDRGQIVGCNHDDDGPGGIMMDDMYGFLFSNGKFSALSTKATMNYGLTADGGVTTGNVTINGVTHGFLASNDVIVPFDFPFSRVTNAYDMTPSGNEIVGAYRDSANKVRGFLLRLVNPHSGLSGPFEFVPIDYPGATATQPFGINPQGDVVGVYVDATGNRHGFFLTRGHNRGDVSETGVPQNATGATRLN